MNGQRGGATPAFYQLHIGVAGLTLDATLSMPACISRHVPDGFYCACLKGHALFRCASILHPLLERDRLSAANLTMAGILFRSC
jgi:hypothetical protein